MAKAATGRFQVGDWEVDPSTGELRRGGEVVQPDPRILRLLLCLARRPGAIFSADELLAEVWQGVVVTQDSVYQAVASLRRLLGDDSKQGNYIATVPRKGYRLVARVKELQPGAPAGVRLAAPGRRAFHASLIGSGIALLLGASWVAGRSAPPIRLAVLPFLDFSEATDREVFADGFAEELIGRVARIPGLEVPSLSASFFYKGSGVPVAEIARQLKVDYVVDGSVRDSGEAVRIAARLMKTATGFIAWAESYDRASAELLKVQDDIAGLITQSLAKVLK